MADFNKGDRIVKMSGVNAGKYGTINSISDSGTLNVTFDGERLPRFCDPERCGKIGLNAKFKVGDKVKHKTNGLTGIVEGRATEPGNYNVRSEGRVFMWDEDDLVLANACAANAKFKVGDRVWFKAPVTGAKVTAKITATLGGEKYGFVDDDGIQGTIEGNAIYPLNSTAANATFKVGDRVRHGNVMYISKTNEDRLVGTITRWDDDRGMWEVKFKGDPKPVYWSSKEMVKYNSRACNRASVYEYGVGDTVKLRSGRTGEVLSKYVDKDGNLSIEINLNGTRYAVSADMVDSVVKNSRACNDRVKGHFVWFAPWNGRAGEAADEIVAKVPGAKREGANIVRVKDADSAATVYALFRKAKVPTRDLNIGFNSSRACNAEITPELRRAYDEWQKAKAKFDKWWNPDRRLSERPPKSADATKKGLEFAAVFKKVTGKLTPNGYGSMTLEQMVDAVSKNACRNASIDDEFPKLKAMGKANAEKYLKDNSQSLIDKYGYPEFVKLAKKIQSIRLKPIKKGRFAGKSGDMTYYVDYTADSMHASRYGKDGTNVTEIQVTGPYVMDPDGKERRHILYYYRSGTESIPAQSSEVRSLVSSIMRGPNVVKQGDAAFAWNACGEDK